MFGTICLSASGGTSPLPACQLAALMGPVAFKPEEPGIEGWPVPLAPPPPYVPDGPLARPLPPPPDDDGAGRGRGGLDARLFAIRHSMMDIIVSRSMSPVIGR